ncbi:MAG: molybdopterin-guanine dinucleotide biosynthesis protein B [Campylobacteraceae bacterium]|nr:molybdopterin-guanine dinucleotide biosynthesis protein B [Campylobacteraceae bacterium]
MIKDENSNSNFKYLAVAFTGPSNSGKTTLIVKVANILQDAGNKVCIVKHDPKDKARFDRSGKDSDKFSQTGSDVAVISPNRTTVFKKNTSTIEEVIELFGNFDYMLLEGLKTLPLPRIAVFRKKLDLDYFKVSNAIAIDETISDSHIPSNIDKLDLNNPEQIIEWINKNAKRVKE